MNPGLIAVFFSDKCSVFIFSLDFSEDYIFDENEKIIEEIEDVVQSLNLMLENCIQFKKSEYQLNIDLSGNVLFLIKGDINKASLGIKKLKISILANIVMLC